jgi:hypothetical protein
MVIVEKIYTYNYKYTLLLIEIIRDGVSRYKIFDVDIFGDPVYSD